MIITNDIQSKDNDHKMDFFIYNMINNNLYKLFLKIENSL